MNNNEEPIVSNTHSHEVVKSSKLALSIALLALFFTAIGITAGYKHWMRIHIKSKDALKEIALLKEQIKQTVNKELIDKHNEALTTATAKNQQMLEKTLKKIDSVSQQTHYVASTIDKQVLELTHLQVQHNPNITASEQSQLAYVHFILKSASYHLSLLHDKQSTLEALKSADRTLIEIGSPKQLELRQRIAHDIATVEQYEAINTEVLSSQISLLDEAITPLAPVEKEASETTEMSLLPISSDEKSNIKGTLKEYLNHSITLRKTTEQPYQLLNSNDKERIDQLISLRLETLRLMLLQQQDKEYHRQIKQLIKTLNKYYSNSQSEQWIKDLEALNKVQLNTNPPTLTSTLTIEKKEPLQ